MRFDRQVLFLALLLSSENALAAPFSLSAIENVSVELPAIVSASAVVDFVSHAAKIFPLQNDSPASNSAIRSGHSSDLVYAQSSERFSSIPVASASATASPSQSSLTSPNTNERLLSSAKATQASTGPTHVKSGSPEAGDYQLDIDNKMAASISASGDASATASADDALDTIESLFNSVYSQVNSALTSVAASSAGGAITSSVSVAATASSISAAATESSDPTSTNALNVLFSALPSSIANPIQSEINSIFPGLLPADQSSTTTEDSSQTTQTTDQNTRTSPTDSPTHQPTRTGQRTRTRTGRPTHTRPTHQTTPTTPHTTLQTSPSSTASTGTGTGTNTLSSAENTGNPDAELGAHPISNASIAGIASGLGAGFVVAGLAGLYLFRRKSQGKAMFGGLGRGGSKRSTGSGPYPAVAWLYDPKMTPPEGRSRSGSVADGAEERLIPERPNSVEPAGSSAPILPPARPSSPLLAPHMPPARERSLSPNRSRSGSNSDASQSLLRPVSQE